MSSKYLPTGIYQLESESKYNVRYKYIRNKDGSFSPYEEMYSNRYIFNPHKVEEHGRSRRLRREQWCSDLDEMYGYTSHYKSESTSKEESLSRSKRRAKSNIKDLVVSNAFECFVTLTLNDENIDRKDYKAIIKKLNTWLDNRVRRCGLKYVGVPELHKDGAIHFHLLCNDVLNTIYSGCVIRPTGGKPVKESTATRQGFNLDECHKVYNIEDWKLGFSTMYHTYGDVMAVANYVVKYITKNNNKVGGRWYYSGGDLCKPIVLYDRVSFNDVIDYDYDFECDGGAFKVKQYTNKCSKK